MSVERDAAARPIRRCRRWAGRCVAGVAVLAGHAGAQPLDPFAPWPPLGETAAPVAPPSHPAVRGEAPLAATATAGEPAPEHADMFVGETRVFSAPGVARVAVGNGRVLRAATADDREVVVFGHAAGLSSLVIWDRDGASRRLDITVSAVQARGLQRECRHSCSASRMRAAPWSATRS